jgi:hypothetical protein
MPPRYAYWTILVGDQPTAFRSGSQEDLMPTFKRLQAKSPDAKMLWFQNGKLWPSRIDAQEAMRARGEMGRRGDDRQLAPRSFSEGGAGFRSRDREFKPTTRFEKPEWKPRSGAESASRPKTQDSRPKTTESAKLDWKPKGEFTPAPKRSERPEWKSKTQDARPRTTRSERPAWKPSGDDTRSAKPEWKPKGSFDRKTEWKPKGSFDRERKPAWKPKAQDARPRTPRSEKLDWKPKGATSEAEGRGPRRSPEGEGGPEKRKWVPKAEYKKSLGIEAKRDGKWRPGGEHRDPRQKYKDAKKAKWTKFKKTIRTKWESKKKKP